MFDLNQLQAVVRLFEASPLTSLDLEGPAGRLRLTKAASGVVTRVSSPASASDAASEAPAAMAPAPALAVTPIAAPLAGVFRAGHPMRAAPFVAAGDRVRAGDVVGLLQVGVLLAPVVAPADGRVGDAVAADGATVGYGTPLLALAAPRD
jgi:biotin carboxyl carrier protein